MAPPKGHAPYNTKGEGGRPLKYTEEFINNEADELEIWMKEKDNIFIEDFCFNRGYSDDRIHSFVKNNDRFMRAYSIFKTKQKSALFNGGLNRKFSFPMCALILSHNHNIHQKSEQKITGSSTNPVACIIQDIDGDSKDLLEDNSSNDL